ncbi:kappaPI-actitoxin-Avd3a-like [Centruroides sculpturatus]|uniref:kappaPI-actitoxin-Avd3a-like n=1 Tax=Centruroides sculpturatus TaxID=218467 RepID=UPI000C6D3183|nr:kappaPI-actitoxin-Avd3a-like [Centruroides sculpturatus]
MKILLVVSIMLIFFKVECRRKSRCCKLEKVVGPCLAYGPSYFYNKYTGKCEFFVYGGCGGNCNRFGTQVECCEVCGDYRCYEDVV